MRDEPHVFECVLQPFEQCNGQKFDRRQEQYDKLQLPHLRSQQFGLLHVVFLDGENEHLFLLVADQYELSDLQKRLRIDLLQDEQQLVEQQFLLRFQRSETPKLDPNNKLALVHGKILNYEL